jgi:dihydroorotase
VPEILVTAGFLIDSAGPILDMPNTNPATTTTKLLLNKELFVSDNSYVDYGFHFLLTKDNFSEILKLSPEKVASVKVFRGC